jgi:hypothetical protein
MIVVGFLRCSCSRRRPVVAVENHQGFPSSCENHQENIAEGTLSIFIGTADSTGLPVH